MGVGELSPEETPVERPRDSSGKRRENVGKDFGGLSGKPSINIPELAALVGIPERSVQCATNDAKTWCWCSSNRVKFGTLSTISISTNCCKELDYERNPEGCSFGEGPDRAGNIEERGGVGV